MTLIKSNPDYKPARNQLVADVFGAQNNTERDLVSATLRAVDVDSDAESDKTGVQFGAYERLQRTSERLGIFVTDATLTELSRDVQTLFLEYLVVYNEPNLLDTLEALRQDKRKIALTSNTGFIDGVYMRSALAKAEILDKTDAQIFSNEVGAAKPHQRIFQATARALALPMREIVHVGDNSIADYAGATKAGMQAVYLTSKPSDIESAYPTIANAYEAGAL